MESKDPQTGPGSVSRGGCLSLMTPEGARGDCAHHLNSSLKGLRAMGMNLDLWMSVLLVSIGEMKKTLHCPITILEH